KHGQIISASRRTDIPSFYGDWFYQQIIRGFVDVPSPFSNKISRISLKPDEVDAIVFWSKEYKPFIPILKKIESLYEHHFLFHFTINGFQGDAKQLFEPNTPDFQSVFRTATFLSEHYGKESVLWRFDPIILSSITPADERIKTFAFLAGKLEGIVARCYVSFVDLYGKVQRRFKKHEQNNAVHFYRPQLSEQVEISRQINTIASNHGIRVFCCCENNIADFSGISRGHCIDTELLQRLYPETRFRHHLKPTRKECGCYASRDIGTYNTCQHHCLYCYANQ
ncbi:MAG: DUF1848 domain-containing protein, partial [Candidatus Marinimicrobia bacterium]|nr:DUF1848 domain-containing protein [Candidatus Neomarinimicrobiota bacterium]